jgi:hypothetical protein
MWRLSESLAKEIMSKIKTPEIDSSGNTAFLPKSLSSLGVIDSMVAVGTDYFYSIECPGNVIYPELPVVETSSVKGYFLYKREELQKIDEPWEVQRVFVDPICTSADERIDVREAAVQIASDIDKLTAPTISTMEQLISKVPLIIDCLMLGKP